MTISDESVLYPELVAYVRKSEGAFDQIPGDRRAKLELVAAYVQQRAGKKRGARLTFICTHNSRRSHMAQIWAQTAAALYGVAGVHTFSGGTEATAFHPNAVAALRRAGFAIEKSGDGDNPVYTVRFGADSPVLEAFSKVYSAAPNPSEGYCAVMTCSEADSKCPVVVGADLRVAVHYEDPKESDGTGSESARYDETCRQVSREMLYLFSLAGQGR